ncbi:MULTISPECIES: transposase, partial [unclassified Fusobacterium]|uniref:transposase n=1 Tax=unclassified Fusobacterium TaxID=2648384 RepID=UPI001B8C9EE9
NSFLSKNLKLSILLRLKDKISLKDIAKEHFVSITIVQRIMNHGYKDLFVSKNTLSEVLCFDEFKSTKDSLGAMSFIFMDAVNRKIIDIVENRQLNSLEGYFSKFSFEARKNIKHIVIDMYLHA